VTPVESAQVRGALGWSTISTLILRVGTFVVGIVLARILSPEQFGVFAVALTVQAVLITLADLGLSADLIRTAEPRRIAPTVATLGLVAGAVMTAGMALSAHSLASLLGSPAAGDVIVVLSFTLVLGGAGLVPYAMLQRRFQQKRLFLIAVIDFIVGTTITLVLLWAGWGVMALAVGRVAAQSVTLILQFALSGERPRYGIDPTVVRPVLAFGLPIAAANLLSWALLNIDNVVISRISGPVALGFYFLAFNISSWPMSALGQIVRSIALPTFSRSVVARNDPSLATATSLTWAVALPAGAFLALLSGPLIAIVYGDKWAAAAPVLAALGLFGAVRAIFDLIVAYLLSRGASRVVLVIQVLWFVLLVPATILSTLWWGIEGAAWSHLAVSLAIVLPAYLIAARRSGANIRLVLSNGWQPVTAMIPAGLTVLGATLLLRNDLWALIVGGCAGGAIYLLLMFRWVRGRIPPASSPPAPDPVKKHFSPVEERNS